MPLIVVGHGWFDKPVVAVNEKSVAVDEPLAVAKAKAKLNSRGVAKVKGKRLVTPSTQKNEHAGDPGREHARDPEKSSTPISDDACYEMEVEDHQES